MQDYQNRAEQECGKICEHLVSQIASLHSNRATPALVEDIPVNTYGSVLPLKQVASIAVPDARTIIIQPWDAGTLQDIQKSIEQSSLGAAPIADQNFIRLNLPQISDERRKEIEKLIGKKVEEARVAVRCTRDDIRRNIQAEQKNNVISEDEKFRLEDDLQKAIDKFNKRIIDIQENKIKELYS